MLLVLGKQEQTWVMNNQSNSHRRKYIATWQVKKMQSIIQDRWSEVWQSVQARDLEQKGINDFSKKSQGNYNLY